MKSSWKRRIFAGISGTLFALLMVTAWGCRTHRTGLVASDPPSRQTTPAHNAVAERGHHLFLQNCAHCHGDDAHGDEGPDLHGVTKSDEKITRIISNGIKGEMPKFSAKLSDTDVQALIAFIRTLD